MSTFKATPLPDLAAVRLEVAGAAAGALPITRTDRNGTRLVRQLPGQETSAGLLVVVDYEPALDGDVRYDLEAPRTNALANPSFETTTADWAGGAVRDTTAAYAGAASARVTTTTDSEAAYPVAPIAATAGKPWSVSFYVKGTAGKNVSVGFITDLTGGATNYDVAPWVRLSGDWQRVYHTYTTPAGTVSHRPVLFFVEPQTAWFDAALFEQTDRLEAYLEGTDPAAPLTRTVTLGGASAPLVTLPVRPQDRSSVKALEDYDQAARGGTVRHSILGGGTVANLRPLEDPTGTLVLRVDTYEEAAQVVDVLDDAEVALFRQPTYAGLDRYFTVDGVRVAPVITEDEWRVSVTFAAAAPPAGDLLGAAGWTVDDVVALGVTVADLPALFPTVYSLAVGPS